jgi:hypothetical protein
MYHQRFEKEKSRPKITKHIVSHETKTSSAVDLLRTQYDYSEPNADNVTINTSVITKRRSR